MQKIDPLSRFMDLTGQRFGKLLVISFQGREAASRSARWLCWCDCGKEAIVRSMSLRSGHTSSCGCKKFRGKPIHVPTYQVWTGIKRRCFKPSASGYQNYGAKGIVVCDRWRNSFTSFLEDMGERPDRSTIDRIDNSKGYEPGNCRWATSTEQIRNRRITRWLMFRGETRTLKEWADTFSLGYACVHHRLDMLGWSVEDALTQPANANRRLHKDGMRI